MNKLRISVGQKILIANIFLIAIFIANILLVSFKLSDNSDLIYENTAVITPSINVLSEFNHVITKSKFYTTNWIYQKDNEESKELLRKLHAYEFLNVKNGITKLKNSWKNKEDIVEIDSILVSFYENVLIPQKQIMSIQLGSNSIVHRNLNIEKSFEQQIKPYSELLAVRLNKLIAKKNDELDSNNRSIIRSSDNVEYISKILAVLLLLIVIVTLFIIRNIISKPIRYLSSLIDKLSRGKIPDLSENKPNTNNDEIGDIALSIGELVNGLQSTIAFAKSIGSGQYEYGFTPMSEDDVLGNTLISMKENLISVAEESQTQNWSSSGIAMFAEILRKNHDDLQAFYYNILFNLVKYLDANQGGVFIIEEEADTPYMKLESCYAWDKKKYREKIIKKGEGLAGQSWLEQETIYLTDIPNEHIKITSGLGYQKPKCILITPIVFNDVIHGVVELASFQEFRKHEIKFVEQVSELFASTLATVKINQRTKYLLEESTSLTEQLRAQEEELRQNMEELQATQEEMRRNQKELELKDNETQRLLKETEGQNEKLIHQDEKMKQQMEELKVTQEVMKKAQRNLSEYKSNLDGLINNTDDTIFAIDTNYAITVINKTLIERLSYDGLAVGIGDNILDILPEKQQEFWREKYDRALDGEAFSFEQKRKVKDKTLNIQVSLNPIYDTEHLIVGASVISRDITAIKEQEAKIQELLEKTTKDAKEIKNQKDFYDSILAFVNGAMYRCNASNEQHWEFQYISKGIYELTGYQESEFLDASISFSDIMHPEDKEKIDEDVDNSESEFNVTYRIITKNNAIRWVHEKGMKVHDRKSGELLAIGFIYDVSEEKKQEKRMQKYQERLERSEERSNKLLREAREQNLALEKQDEELLLKEAKLNSILNNTDASIIAIDKDYKVILINDTYKKRYEGTPYVGIDEGAYVLDMLGDVRDEWKEYYDRGFKGEAFDFIIKSSLTDKDTYRHYYINPIKSEKEIIGISVFSRDVTIERIQEIENESLLVNLQEHTEELKAQEEELRQNLEEMTATHEEMEKIQKELAVEKMHLHAILNNTDASIISLDRMYNITLMNDVLVKRYIGTQFEDIKVGMNAMDLLGVEAKIWKKHYDRGLSGERFDFITKSTVRGEDTFRHYYINPIKREEDVVGVSVFSMDVTEAKLNETQNQKLIESLKEQTEALRGHEEELLAQEEEMKQNLEEMETTHERMVRIQDELIRERASLDALINNTDASIIAIDRNYEVLLINESYKNRYKGSQYEGIDKGSNVLNMLGDVRDEWKGYYDRCLNGETFDFTIKSSVHGEESYRHYYFNPIKEGKEIFGVSVFSRDVTKETLNEIRNKEYVEDIQKQTEQLQAHEEELKQTIEEMEATQEVMEKVQKELADEKMNLNALINTTDACITSIDKKYIITLMNEVQRNRYVGTQYEDIDVGTNILDLLGEVRNEWKGYYDRAIKGEHFDFIIKSSVQGEDSYRQYFLSPIKDSEQIIVGVSVFSRDVTKAKLNELENERLLADVQTQAEELLQQAEELEQQRDSLAEANISISAKNREINARLDDIKVLSEIGQKVTASVNIDEIISILYVSINNLMDAPNFEIGLINELTQELDFTGFLGHGSKLTYVSKELYSLNTLSTYAIQNEEIIYINDVNEDIKKYISNKPAMLKYKKGEARSIIYLPLKLEQKIIGLLIVRSFRENAYSDVTLDILQNLGAYISIALDNAKAYNEIDKKNQSITENINVALTIQEAILPDYDMMDNLLKDYFIIYRPKDIVSGDFYWLNKVDNKVIIAVVDCTGHGVSGAFMSMIGSSTLSRIIIEKGVTDPEVILDELDKEIKVSLKQDITNNREGMDLCICTIEENDDKTFTLRYSGAKNDFYYLESGSREIQIIHADKRSIGGISANNHNPFTVHELNLKKGAQIYLTTDGYKDQNNNIRKRLGTNKLLESIVEISELTMFQQGKRLEEILDNFQGQELQRDDIAFIGFKI